MVCAGACRNSGEGGRGMEPFSAAWYGLQLVERGPAHCRGRGENRLRVLAFKRKKGKRGGGGVSAIQDAKGETKGAEDVLLSRREGPSFRSPGRKRKDGVIPA